MLKLHINEGEFYDSYNNYFINVKEQDIVLEHSLLALSKWESKWKKPFFSKERKTNEESLDYIRCMTITPNVDPMVFNLLTDYEIKKVQEYIEDPMTATTIRDDDKKHSNEIVTSELIYYWMVALQIPFECQKWNLNRLLTLIKICNIKNQPSKKMNRKDLIKRNKNLNAARRAAANSKG